MDKTTFQKIQLGIDLSFCSMCLLLTLHNYPFYTSMYFLWVLRIWTSFLIYRRSSMAAYAIGMSAIGGLLVFLFSPHITGILLDVVKAMTSLFGGDGRMLVHEIRMDARNGEYWNTLYKVVGCITYLWLVVGPLVQYIAQSIKKRVIQSSWSKRRSLLLCLYLMGIMLMIVIGSYKDFLGFLLAVVGLYALPYLFREIDFHFCHFRQFVGCKFRTAGVVILLCAFPALLHKFLDDLHDVLVGHFSVSAFCSLCKKDRSLYSSE